MVVEGSAKREAGTARASRFEGVLDMGGESTSAELRNAQIVRYFLIEAIVLSLKSRWMRLADLKGFLCSTLFG